MRDAPALITAAGLACLAAAWLTASPARATERPARVWQVVYADGSVWRTPRGHQAIATSETACGLALVEAVRFVESGTRLMCRRMSR